MRHVLAQITRRVFNWIGESLGIALPACLSKPDDRTEKSKVLEQKLRACSEALAAAVSLKQVLQAQIKTLESLNQETSSGSPTNRSGMAADKVELEKRLAEAENRCAEIAALRDAIIRQKSEL